MEYIKKEYETHKEEIKKRLGEFFGLDRKKWFHELVFCILTPQSNAEKCWNAVLKLKEKEFEDKVIESCIIKNTRFHRNKTRYLKEAKNKWQDIEKKVDSINKENVKETRNWIAENVTGLGLKEASHFLRNIGKSYNHLAILDRHILSQLEKTRVINKLESLNRKNYLIIEEKMKQFSEQVEIPLDALDLLFFKLESGRIFK